MSPEEIYERQMQKLFRQEIDDLYAQLTDAQDTFTVTKCEARLRFLSTRIVDDPEEISNMDSLIKRASDERAARSQKGQRQAQSDFFSKGISWGNQSSTKRDTSHWQALMRR
jgi:hypothetical protein